jgi:hypothetical protein
MKVFDLVAVVIVLAALFSLLGLFWELVGVILNAM